MNLANFQQLLGLIKYIMLLKLPIILSGNSFNFYLLPIIPKIIPKLLLQIYYKNHNILLIKHKTYHLLS